MRSTLLAWLLGRVESLGKWVKSRLEPGQQYWREIVRQARPHVAARFTSRGAGDSPFDALVLRSLRANIAVLDRTGTIIAVNDAWRRFALENGSPILARASEGMNYLEVAWRSAREGAPGARAAYEGILAVLQGQREEFTLEYPCHSPTERRWYMLYVTPLIGNVGGATAMHLNITELKLAEEQAEVALRSSEARFRALVQHSTDIITILDTDATIRYQSPSVERVLGYRSDELIGRSALALIHPDDLPVVLRLLEQSVTTPGAPLSLEYRFRHKDGSWRVLESIGTNQLAEPAVGGLVINSRDITERRRIEQALVDSEERFRQLAEHIHQIIWMRDVRTQELLYVSPAFEETWGRSLRELYDDPATWYEAIHPDDRERVRSLHAQHMQEGYEIEYRIVRPDGEIRWIGDQASPIRSALGEVYRIVGVAEDITERKHADEELLRHALYDTLTGLANRTLFQDRLKHAMAHAKRHPDFIYAVLFLDLDRFKTVNDSLGHLAGDQLLIEVAQRLIASLRPADTVARFGGDEFAILVEEIHGIKDATDVADRIQESLARPFKVEGHEVVISASIGIAMSTSGYERPEEILRDADLAQYRAKARGKARSALFDSHMHDDALELLKLEAELRRAIEREEFILYYQPIVSLATGGITRVEVLLRWQHPERGSIMPVTFIPLAEETDLIVPLGDWVLRKACEQHKFWLESGLPPICVAVNLSARQFKNRNLPARVAEILAETGLAKHCLELELTETSVVEQPEAAVETLEELRALGVHTSIDDFGTGHSSLGYLKRFPITTVKIDQLFVRDVTTNPHDAAIAAATISIAHSLNLEVIAEGVETREQLAFLREQKCDAIQGFLISHPLPADRVTPLLRRRAHL